MKIFKSPNELKSLAIFLNNETKTILISKLEHLSPSIKIPKPTTPVKDVHRTIEQISEIDDDLRVNFKDMSLQCKQNHVS